MSKVPSFRSYLVALLVSIMALAMVLPAFAEDEQGTRSIFLPSISGGDEHVKVADLISTSNDVDAVALIMPLNVGGDNGTTQLYVIPQNGDGKNGCNLIGVTTLVISISSSDTSVATVSPSSITFTQGCANVNPPTITVTPHDEGSAIVSVSLTSNSTAGTFNFAPATFTVNVVPPANTAPTVAVAGVTGGAPYPKGSVPTATCQVTDAEDGNSSFAATLSAITGPYASDGIGSQTASCSYTDGGGLTAEASVTYSIVDPSPPSIGSTLNPASADGSNGWYKSDVTLVWTVSEPESPNSLAETGCVNQSITNDQAEQTYSCEATSAGGSAGPVDVKIKRDATDPTISGIASSAATWTNQDVDVTFTCDDNLSGVASCGPNQTLSSEGAGQSVPGTALDNAGNTASATVNDINIDKTVPTASAIASPGANGNGWNNTDVTVSFSGEDTLSDIASCSAAVVLSSEGAGQSASGTCTDNAGNVSASASATINIDLTPPTVNLVGGPANGNTYYVGYNVPAAPTCSANDALSGLDGSCSVMPYDTTPGTHTVSANASDKAGNTYSASATYTIANLTRSGFYQPVDMGILNNAKAGSTVPLKFEIFAGLTELTGTSYIQTFTQKISCLLTTGDDIEQYSTGNTSLRYDTTGGQFIFNWQTPKAAGSCYKVTMTTSDGQSISADFKLK